MSPYLWAIIWFVGMLMAITVFKLYKYIRYRLKYPMLYKYNKQKERK